MLTIELDKVLGMATGDYVCYIYCAFCEDLVCCDLKSQRCETCDTKGPHPLYVYELLSLKRRDPSYPFLLSNIQEYGFHSPIGIDRDNNYVVNGHHRIAVAEDLNLTEIPVTYDLAEIWSSEWPTGYQEDEYYGLCYQ